MSERRVVITFEVDPCDLSDVDLHALAERLVSQMDPDPDPNVLTYDHTDVLRVSAERPSWPPPLGATVRGAGGWLYRVDGYNADGTVMVFGLQRSAMPAHRTQIRHAGPMGPFTVPAALWHSTYTLHQEGSAP